MTIKAVIIVLTKIIIGSIGFIFSSIIFFLILNLPSYLYKGREYRGGDEDLTYPILWIFVYPLIGIIITGIYNWIKNTRTGAKHEHFKSNI